MLGVCGRPLSCKGGGKKKSDLVVRERSCVRPVDAAQGRWPGLDNSLGLHAGVRELPRKGGYRALCRVRPDTSRNETAGDVLVLRVFGPGQSRERL